jgi:CheY-specific phosphatase CheX
MRDYGMGNHEVLEKFTIRLISYLKTELNIKQIDENFTIRCVDGLYHQKNIVYISFIGDIDAIIGLSVSHNLATLMLKHFFTEELDQESIDELAVQTVEEVLNIVAGNIIQHLDVVKNGGTIEISPPYKEISKTYRNIYLSRIRYGDENIEVSYFQN